MFVYTECYKCHKKLDLGKIYFPDDIMEDNHVLEDRLKRYGWKDINGNDYCQDCLKELGKDKQ